MTDGIIQLFDVLKQGDPDSVNEANNKISDLYQNPEIIIDLFEIYQETNDIIIKKYCIVSLKNLLKNFWFSIYLVNENMKISISSLLFSILKNENDLLTRRMLIDCIKSTGVASFMCSINDFLDYMLSLKENLVDFFDLLGSLYEYLPYHVIKETIPFYIETSINVFKSEELETIKSCAFATISIFTHTSFDGETSVPLIASLLDKIVNSVSSYDNNYLSDLVNALSGIMDVCDSNVLDNNLTDGIVHLLSNDQICHETRVLFIQPLNIIIQRVPETLSEIYPLIIEHCISLSALSIVDNCFDQQLNSEYISQTLSLLCANVSETDFFEEYWARKECEKEEILLAYVIGLNSFIETIPAIVLTKFEELMQLCFLLIDNDKHHFVEAGLVTLNNLVPRGSSFLQKHSESILDHVILTFSKIDKHSNFIRILLAFLSDFLYMTYIPTEKLRPLLNFILELSSYVPQELLHFLLTTLSAFIKAAGLHISSYSSELIIPIQTALQHEDPYVRFDSMESLSMLLKAIPEIDISLQEQAISIFLSSVLEHSDDLDIFSNGMISLSNIAFTRNQALITNLPNIFQISLSILTKELDEVENEHVDSAILRSKISILTFYDSLAKVDVELVRNISETLLSVSMKLFSHSSDDIQKMSIKLSTRLCKLNDVDLESLTKSIIELIFDSNPNISALGFYGMKRIVKLGISGCSDKNNFLESALSASKDYIKGELPCQIQVSNMYMECEDEIECNSVKGSDCLDLKIAVYDFLDIVAITFPESFSCEEVYDLYNQVKFLGDLDKLNEIIGVFAEFLFVFYANIPELTRYTIVNEFFYFLKIDSYQPFVISPNYISAARVAIEVADFRDSNILRDLFCFLESSVTVPYEGQLYYWPYMSSIVSLILSLSFLIPDIFDITLYLQNIMPTLTFCLTPEESENIILRLCSIYKRSSDSFSEYLPCIIAVLTMSLNSMNIRKNIAQDVISLAEETLEQLL